MGLLGGLAGILGMGGSGDGGAGNLRGKANGYLGQYGDIGSQYGNLANQGFAGFNRYNPQANQSADDYANYLRQDPFTATTDSSYLANATNGSANAYQAASARLSSDLARRGIDPGSSMEAGGLTSLAQGQAGQMAQAQNQLANAKIGQRQQNMANLANLLNGQANTNYSRGIGALGQQGNITRGIAGDYLNEAGQAQQQANYENGQDNGLMGTLGSIAGAFIPGMGGRAMQAAGGGQRSGGTGFGGQSQNPASLTGSAATYAGQPAGTPTGFGGYGGSPTNNTGQDYGYNTGQDYGYEDALNDIRNGNYSNASYGNGRGY